MLGNRHIVLAVTGGIAAYKACELVRLLQKSGARVRVLMTKAATEFVSPLTFAALTGKDVLQDLFAIEGSSGGHLATVKDIDLFVIAPATANIIAKLAHGLADDLVSTAALACRKPLLVCPAMNPAMWANPAVQANIEILQSRGHLIFGPEAGEMAGPEEEPGVGRLPEPIAIHDEICRLLPPDGPLSGKTVTVTAGPTQEAIDPVRVISNLSSGKTGYALAEEARRRGARVHLITGPVHLPPPPGTRLYPVNSTGDMLVAVEKVFEETDILIMAAAPSDYRPLEPSATKIKKSAGEAPLTLNLEQNPDILKRLAARKGQKILVGFALETDNGMAHARQKLQDKKLDLIVLNQPRVDAETGLGRDAIQCTLVGADDSVEELPIQAKATFAAHLVDRIAALL